MAIDARGLVLAVGVVQRAEHFAADQRAVAGEDEDVAVVLLELVRRRHARRGRCRAARSARPR